MKKTIEATTEITTSDVYDAFSSGTPLDEFLTNLEAIEARLLKEGWSDLKIAINIDHGYYDSDSDLEISISGKRLENDKEEAARLREEEREKERAVALKVKKANEAKRKEAEELELYARLKAKYDNKTTST